MHNYGGGTRRKHPGGRAVLAALGIALFVSSCTRPVAGAPLTSDDGVRKAMEQRFKAIVDKVEGYIDKTDSATAVETWKATLNDLSDNSKMSYAYHGDPPTTLINRDAKNPDENVAIYEPAGSDSTYYRLGKKYRHLAPTPWVAVPGPNKDFSTTCTVPGKMNLCKMITAIVQTANNPPKEISKIAYTHPNGSTSLLTNIAVDKFIESHVIIYPENVEDQLSQVILDSLLSARIDLDRHNEVKKVQIKGSVSRAGKKFSVDVVHEITGEASNADFPTTPSGAELTKITAPAKVREFKNKAQSSPPG